jgi:ketosteroid isomerase-like protein
MKKLVLVLALLVAIPVMLVGCSKSQVPTVKDDINGFVTAYNAGDIDKCTDYLVGITDANKETIKGTLQGFKALVQSIEVPSIEEVKVDGSTATASVTLKVTFMGQPMEKTTQMTLTKEDGTWKFSLTALLAALSGG